ncbi:MAG: serine/threonine protein kinase [Sandaracinaceae bacterium]|nr:serine/threonine protein kinase [Sandaracinaceae bacterium]
MRERRPQDIGPYRIVRQLAMGGMAEIYLARQRGLEGIERTVVLKRILERHAHDAEFVTMFLDEARLLAALSHPNIAQVFDVGQVEGTYYLVMEHVRGPTLGKLLASAREAGAAALPRREALGVGLAVAEALHYVHERKDELGRPLDIVHRDLNPANVIVSYDGAVKLIDFGIAKAATKVYETRTGVVKGTYGYIAPEQLLGETPVDRRADVFALGILLYEMCAGVHPYDVSDEPNLIDRVLEARYRRPREVRPDIAPELDDLIARCLKPRPAGRPDDMAVVIEALAGHLAAQRMVPTQHALAALARRLVPTARGRARSSASRRSGPDRSRCRRARASCASRRATTRRSRRGPRRPTRTIRGACRPCASTAAARGSRSRAPRRRTKRRPRAPTGPSTTTARRSRPR